MASQAHPHICPECQTPQTGDSPFCESCGYRLRSQETALEGLPAISPEQLQRASVNRRVHTEEEPALTPEQVKAHAEARHAPSHTFVEGLPAVTPAPPKAAPAPHPSSAPAHIAQENPDIAPADVSALTPMPPPPKSPLTWLGPLVAGLMLGGIFGTAFAWLAAPEEEANTREDASTTEPKPLKKLSFSPGTFTKGLDEPTQVRMLRLCYKLSDDSDKECEQETLLQGEYPRVNQELTGFMLDSVEVTNARYDACVEAGSCTPVDYKSCQVHTTQGLQISLRVPKVMREPGRPVVCITHAQAKTFCAWSKGRLPTHDEWEYAARGTRDGRLFPWGDAWEPTFSNWGERDVTRTAVPGRIDGAAWTSPVGMYDEGTSPFGAFDMAGNVSEWVAHDTDLYQARGGSWTSPAFDLRITKRHTYNASTTRTDLGVRCAYD